METRKMKNQVLHQISCFQPSQERAAFVFPFESQLVDTKNLTIDYQWVELGKRLRKRLRRGALWIG